MAIGDDALAAGMEIMTGQEPANTLDDEVNKTRDYVAQRTSAVTPVAKGGTGASTAAAARASLGVTAPNIPSRSSNVQTDLDYLGGELGNVYRKNEVDASFSARDGSIASAANAAGEANAKATEAKRGQLWNDTYNRAIGGNRRAVWVQDDGALGYAASTERYKKNIRPEDVSDEQVLMLSLVSYQWKVAITRSDRREMGLIAERLVEAGLGWVAFWNEDGTVEGLNYEMIGLVLLPAVQRLIARVARIEDAL